MSLFNHTSTFYLNESFISREYFFSSFMIQAESNNARRAFKALNML